MKILLSITLILFFCTDAQSQMKRKDSIRIANFKLDVQLMDELKEFDFQHYDYIMLRVKDSLNPLRNECTFMVNIDSCTLKYKFQMTADFEIRRMEIDQIDYYNSNDPCKEILGEITANLIEVEGYFAQSIQPFFEIDRAAFLFYGRVNGYYEISYFQDDFFSEFHSGLLYDTICGYLYTGCKR